MHAPKQIAATELDLDSDLELEFDLPAPINKAKPAEQPAPTLEYSLDDTSEIELTAEQMDDLLAGRWQP